MREGTHITEAVRATANTLRLVGAPLPTLARKMGESEEFVRKILHHETPDGFNRRHVLLASAVSQRAHRSRQIGRKRYSRGEVQRMMAERGISLNQIKDALEINRTNARRLLDRSRPSDEHLLLTERQVSRLGDLEIGAALRRAAE